MNRRRRAVRTLITAAAAALFASALGAPALADASSPDGWVRLVHLSPGYSPCDIYLYPFGGSSAQVVLKHISYGQASPYEAIQPGLYLVAMRDAGAAATSTPVISTQIQVAAGQAYTVAGLGPGSALTLKVLDDQLDPPAGKASVRVIEASLDNPSVTVTAGSATLDSDVRFPAVTMYSAVSGGPTAVRVTAAAKSATDNLSFSPGSTYTIAVLDGAGGQPRVLELDDAGGERAMPQGGVQTGLGGTALATGAATASPASRTTEWAALLVAGAGAAAFAARRLRRR